MSEPPKYSNPFQFDMLMLEPVHEMMQTGIRVDQKEKKRLQQAYIDKWNEHQTNLDRFAGMYLNVGSGPQMCSVIYDDIGLPVKKKRGKPTTDDAALRARIAACQDKIDTLKTESAKVKWMRGWIVCRLALNVRSTRKRISSYLGLQIKAGKLHGQVPLEDTDGRIRGTISVGGTETGRFSHSKTLWGTGVNLATIPRELRSMFIADDGYELAEIDLERGESWIYAHLSGDPELLRIHREGDDFHAETAGAVSGAFGEELDVDWITQHKHDEAYKIRYLGKKVNHASSYRMGPFKGAETINKEADDTGITATVAQFKRAQTLWLDKYFMIERWWNEIEQQLGRNRTLTTPYGRIHTFHDMWGKDLFKAATAYVPQSTSVDYINRGLLRVYHRYQKPGAFGGLRILGQTHDSILVQYGEEHRDDALPEIVGAIRSNLTIGKHEFSIPTEASYGQSWGDLVEYEE
jgi:DNA polymerase-1